MNIPKNQPLERFNFEKGETQDGDTVPPGPKRTEKPRFFRETTGRRFCLHKTGIRMEWTEQALVIRLGAFRETDLWVRLLCRSRGLLTVFAFGGSRSRRRFCGCLDVLNELDCRVKSSRDGRFLNLEEASLRHGPQRLRQDWQRMGIAVNCLRFVEALGVAEENAAEAYALLQDFTRTADEAPELPSLSPLFFRWRLAGTLGLAPDMEHCGVCGGPAGEGSLLVVDEGRLRCRTCRAERTAAGVVPERYGVELTTTALDVLRRVQQEFPSEWRRSPLLPADRRACGRAIDGFVQYHLGLAWENGYFRRV